MILYHVTKREFLPSIRERGLVPHVPGVVWDDSDPNVAALTGGKPVVWLTADKTEWRHDAHATNKNPATRLLTVRLEYSKRLVRYAPWLHKLNPQYYQDMQISYAQNVADGLPPQNVEAWHVYFGTIRPDRIIDGLDAEKAERAA
jgi:hypothetical protein